MSSITTTSVQKSETFSSSSSSLETSQQFSSQARARHGSGTQDAVVSGHKFNISSGLKQRSRHVSGAVEAAGVGSALRGLDTALEKIALQQQQESQHYVAKVSNQ